MNVRKYRPADRDAVIALWSGAFPDDPPHNAPPDVIDAKLAVGTALLRHAVRELEALGCIKINLQVRAAGAEAAAFHESPGFAREDRISMGMLAGRARRP